MFVESLIIIAVILATALILIRFGRKDYGYGILPLLLLPAVQIFSDTIAKFLDSFLPISYMQCRVCVVFVPLIVAVELIGLSGARVKKGFGRFVYFLIMTLLTLFLSTAFVLNALGVI